MTNQAKTNNLNCLIDPKFSTVNRLFVLPFENGDDRTSHSKYYRRKVKIKDLNVLIDGKYFFLCANKKQRKNTFLNTFQRMKN